MYFTMDCTAPDSVRFNATLVGQRLEIDVFADDHIETVRFLGNENVEDGLKYLEAILSDEKLE